MSAVEVNECRVFVTTQGAQWWAYFVLAHKNTDRITVLTPSIAGALCSVACDSDDDARWLAGRMVDAGIPQSAVKVRSGGGRG